MLIVLLDEPGLFVFPSAEDAVMAIEPIDAESEIRAMFDDSAVPYRVEWVKPLRRKILFGLLESDEPGEYRLVPAGPPDPAALLALLEAHSTPRDPPEAHDAVLALLERLRSGQTEQRMVADEPDFGPFEAAFTDDGLGAPGYLHFLNLDNDPRNIQIVIDRIARAMAGWETDRWVAAMMGERNWRPHLVGAVAYLLDRGARLDRSLIWQAIDAGSWAIPQLVVTAFFADPLFVERARARLDARCPLAPNPDGSVPVGYQRRGKMAASLLAVGGALAGLSASAARWRGDPDIVERFKQDGGWEQAERIVPRWMSRIRECFDQRGLPLVSAVG